MVKFCLLSVFAAASVCAQTNVPSAQEPSVQENNIQVLQHVEELRAQCIHERRIICGKIIQILPDGVVVDSGYTNLMRAPLNQSWLIPASVTAQRATNIVESSTPDSVCIGPVFLIDLPRPPRGTKLKLFDYVVLDGFPMGKFTYTSIGDVQHTVRQFSAKVTTAIRWRYGREIEEQEKVKSPPSN